MWLQSINEHLVNIVLGEGEAWSQKGWEPVFYIYFTDHCDLCIYPSVCRDYCFPTVSNASEDLIKRTADVW